VFKISKKGMPQSGIHFQIFPHTIQYMSTIQIGNWQPLPIESLAEGLPVKMGKIPLLKTDMPKTVGISGEDLTGMAWMFLEDDYS
jgi:hypothetical protein